MSVEIGTHILLYSMLHFPNLLKITNRKDYEENWPYIIKKS